MLKHCDKSCGECEFVDRGYDDCCHEVFCISDRCPLNKIMQFYRKVNHVLPPVEWMTSYIGCVYFKFDEEYKLWNEEVDRMNKERNENSKKNGEL